MTEESKQAEQPDPWETLQALMSKLKGRDRVEGLGLLIRTRNGVREVLEDGLALAMAVNSALTAPEGLDDFVLDLQAPVGTAPSTVRNMLERALAKCCESWGITFEEGNPQ